MPKEAVGKMNREVMLWLWGPEPIKKLVYTFKMFARLQFSNVYLFLLQNRPQLLQEIQHEFNFQSCRYHAESVDKTDLVHHVIITGLYFRDCPASSLLDGHHVLERFLVMHEVDRDTLPPKAARTTCELFELNSFGESTLEGSIPIL